VIAWLSRADPDAVLLPASDIQPQPAPWGRATNPLPVIVSCHRVFRSNGSADDSIGGSTAKQKLLDLERGYDLAHREQP
jgi:hypothetical protein